MTSSNCTLTSGLRAISSQDHLAAKQRTGDSRLLPYVLVRAKTLLLRCRDGA
jgi:hypothetical protein